MIQIKRRFHAGAVFAVFLLMLALSIQVIATPSSASLVVTNAAPVAAAPQTLLSIALAENAFPAVVTVSYSGMVRFLIAQADIPNVLVPPVPSAEPTFYQNSPTPQPTKVPTNVSKNATQTSTGTGYDLGKIAGSVSPFFIIALIPLLFVIGALFYFFFMGDQERRGSDGDQEADTELINVSEETGWREL